MFENVIWSVENNLCEMFCINACGGTGKTYLIILILSKVKSTNKKALATNSSGIASTLLRSGLTFHSRLVYWLLMEVPWAINSYLNVLSAAFRMSGERKVVWQVLQFSLQATGGKLYWQLVMVVESREQLVAPSLNILFLKLSDQ